MKFSHIMLLGCGMLLTASCSSVRHTADVAPVSAKVVSYTVADLEVSPAKSSLTYSWSFNPFRRVSISTVKQNTEARMLQDAGADVLVEPQYIVNQRGFLRGGSVTVIGFPAKYRNFHKMTPAEAELFNKVEIVRPPEKPHKRWLIF